MSVHNDNAENLEISECLCVYDELTHELTIFMNTVADWFSTHPKMSIGNTPLIHSVKRRIKPRDHLSKSGP